MNFKDIKWNSKEYTKYIKYLESLASNNLKNFNSNIYNEKDKKIIGIRIPVLRDISKEILKGDAEGFLNYTNNTYVEENIIEGFVIANLKEEIASKLEKIDKFIPKISNWAICDTFVPALKIVKKNRNEYLKYIQKYISEKDEFVLRFYVVSLLDYYIEDDTIDFVFKSLNSITSEYYYVKMAIAWLLCEVYIYYPEKTLKFMQDNNSLDKFTINKAISKMVDSYRISKEEKIYLKNLKK